MSLLIFKKECVLTPASHGVLLKADAGELLTEAPRLVPVKLAHF
jgi:hypothetical protein